MNWESLIVALVGAASGGGATFFALRDRLNVSDTTAATEDARQNLLKTLMSERDEARNDAREAVDQRTLLASEVSRLKESLAASERERLRVSHEYAAFKRMVLRLYPEMEDYIASHPMELDPLVAHPKGKAP